MTLQDDFHTMFADELGSKKNIRIATTAQKHF